MKKSTLFAGLVVLFATVAGSQGQISVGAGGSGTLSFGARPPTAEWSTRAITGGDPAFTDAAGLNAAVATNVASSITTQVLDGLAGNPPVKNALAQWTSAGGAYLTTRPTGNGATLLMATLRNDTGASANTLAISYTLTEGGAFLIEQVPEHQVYYSLTGAANSWAVIPELSGGGAGAKSHPVNLAGNWNANGLLYVLWADDNAPNGDDQAQEIDDISFTAGVAVIPLNVTLTAPPNGQLIVAPDNVTNFTVSAIAGGTVPATSVSFYTNGVLVGTDTTPPYSVQINDLPAGLYAIQAVAANGSETASSTVNTVKIRPQFVNYTGGLIVEDFDVMGSTGTETPVG